MSVSQFSSLNDLRDFMRAHSLFVLCYPLSKKSQKRRQKITYFNVVLLYVMVVICRHFEWLKVLKLSKICLKMVKAMTQKITDQKISFPNERIPFNLHCRFNECAIKLLILINNPCEYTTAETLVCQTQDVCGRFQSEKWRQHVSTGHSYD